MRCRRGEKGRWINQGISREERRRSPRFWASISPPGNRDNPSKHSGKATTSTAGAGAGAGSSSTNTTTAMQKALPSSMHPHDQQLASTLRHIQEEKGHRGRTDESWLPEKRILGLVLDTLQRRDTYEIFAEPVDPSEVEEYYEIIKEPMDFGTMRAKLHEGMYKNLQQFEVLQSIYAVGNMGLSNWQEKHRPIATHASPHDVFLIFGNAMHFNSSATVYFRQARALEELAKKVFHALRTDPKNFELECAATRRRSSRGTSYGEFKDSNFGSCRKLDRDLQSNDMNPNVRRRGYKRERRSCMTMSGIDRRSTYKRRTLLDEKFSALSPIHHGPTPLIHVNNGDQIGYKESLMLFVKDLGPTAQRVAKCKLQDCLQMQTPSNPPGSNEGSNSKPVQAVGFSRFRSCTLSNQRNMNNINIHGNLVGNFDLNQVQSLSSDSSPTTAGWFKNDDYMSNMVSSVPAPLPVPVPVPMPAGQFTFDLSYLKSRMRELNDADCLSYSHKMGSQGTIDAWYG